jgi:hypothetical protein
MKTATLSSLSFAEHIEEKGFLAFGEPYVHYDIFKETEKLTFYLTYPTHGVHSILFSTKFVSNSSVIRKSLFNEPEENQKPNVSLLSEFVAANPKRSICIPENLELKRAAGFVGTESNKKKLTWLLARNILVHDREKSSIDFQDKEKQLSSIIRSTSDSIGRPEQVAYLSRFDSLTENDINEFMNFPLEWLYRSLKPSKLFYMITMPSFDKENNHTMNRKVIFL